MSTNDISTRIDTIKSAQRFAGRERHEFPTVTEAVAFEILRRAQIACDFAEHEKKSMHTSARLCEQDAGRAFERSDWSACARRALDSLTYSTGMFSSTYADALELAARAA